MTDSYNNHEASWRQLESQAVSGDFQMDFQVGEALRSRCEALLQELRSMRTKAQRLAHLSGYGLLPSSLALKQKFERKAAGGGEHDLNDSAVARLDQNIAIVELMHDTYAAAIGKLQQNDQSAASEMTAQTEGGG
ncbi:hypothetical protein IU443_25280 [Nocardia farcinica]|nr:hypothetical protein [Nocardia farcinica]MBF6281913.1 hypothetical protein [Nocardia farcinica]MBF6306673.1 hypothetical protein [Nocardia farcinica]MBF6393250.1 hypothetical protein [Nocardia farcinica]MBF6490333.1 hypothetical protein [Nocardia farcinica]